MGIVGKPVPIMSNHFTAARDDGRAGGDSSNFETFVQIISPSSSEITVTNTVVWPALTPTVFVSPVLGVAWLMAG